MSIRDRFGWPSYDIPEREPDFFLLQRDSEYETYRVNYWVHTFIDLKNFTVLYGWENGNFKDGLALIFSVDGETNWRFEENKEYRPLDNKHSASLIEKLKAFIDETVEKEVLGDD